MIQISQKSTNIVVIINCDLIRKWNGDCICFPDPWLMRTIGHRGYRYTFIDDLLTFDEAVDTCAEKNLGTLLEIESALEHEFVKSSAYDIVTAITGSTTPLFIGVYSQSTKIEQLST